MFSVRVPSLDLDLTFHLELDEIYISLLSFIPQR